MAVRAIKSLLIVFPAPGPAPARARTELLERIRKRTGVRDGQDEKVEVQEEM